MNNRDIQYFEIIGEYCDDVSRTLKRFGQDFSTFVNDYDYYNSVLMGIFQIGEIVNKLSDSAREELDCEIESHKIIAVRNRIAHAYDDLDKHVIWNIAAENLPSLKLFCEKKVEENSHLLSAIDYSLIEDFQDKSY
ncbi:MAG: DUF86 domain-containing protein [Coriobacteriia bacterium]|nr:DUF86 domain-containing protein [Coriobacteriia bacterium]